ncbi:NACHT domain-containing protein [Hirsutella rhossiliensis]
MDWVRSGLVLLAGVAGAIYLWLAKNKENTRPQPAVGQGHSTSESSPERKKDRPRPPLEILYPGPTDFSNDDTEIDIVAVHGLGSNVDWSWTWKDDEKCINWLRDPGMLPAKVPKSRIIAYNYESRWHADAPKTRLQLCGEELVHSLHLFRDGAPDRPIVFVGHSLGGNVIVHALLHARDEENYKHLPMATVGLVFLGTPFRGTKWQPFVDSLAQLMGSAGSHRGITRELGFDGPELLDRLHRFCRLRNSLSTPVSCFSELYETDYGRRLGVSGVAKGMIVEEASACIPGLDRYALQTDHLKINKYQGPTDRSFERVSAVISEMCRGAKDVVRRRHDPREIVTDNRSALKHKPEAETCLVDLFVTDPLEDKMNLKRKKGDRARGTCEWILGTEALTAWLGPSQTELTESQATNVLWLRGYPGTGKSTMAIFLTEALSAAFSATYGKTLAYFFCDSGFGTRKTATSVVRGLLLQLVQQHPQLLDYVLPKYNERRAKLFESFDALWTIFMAAAADQHTGQKYCIIDALDECDQESQKILLRQLQETFQSQHAPSNLRILITSRPYPEIREYLEIFANEDLASFPEAKQDIDRCIQERVANLAERKRYTDKVKGRVGDILRDKADGTFLWVGLACNELEDVPSKDAIPVLEGMPKGLHSLYKRLLHTALERDTAKADDVRLILSFVAVCLRPLSVLELSEACQLHMNEDDAETRAQFTREHVESCRLMVIIQDEKVLLLHQSVKDFLAEAGADHFINELKAHARLAHRCVDLLIKEFRDKKQSPTHFSEYATEEWANHARKAQSRFEVKSSQADFFETNSLSREHWLSSYRRSLPKWMEPIPPQFSIFHVAAKWGVPALADYASRSDDQHDGAREIVCPVDCVDASGVTPLECATMSEYPSAVSVLLDLGGTVTARVTQTAAGNLGNGKEVMTLLLDRRGDQITITDEVVKAAAGNFRNGKEVMALLLDRRGDQITITDGVVKAAAGNEDEGKEVMALLLDRRGDQITITDEVVKAAAGNSWNGKEVMALLLDQRGDQITITDEVVKAAAGNSGNGKEVMALLLDRRGDQITITDEVVKAAAGNFGNGKEVMALLLDRRGDQITITDEVVKAAAGNFRNGKEVMALLLNRRGDQITITDEVVKAAAGNSGNGKEVMTLLLDRRGDQITITDEVVKAAAGNEDEGKKVMALILDRRGDQITITDEVVKAAAGNSRNGREVIALLLDRQRDQITITDEVVKAAAGNSGNGKEVMALLLDRRGDQITITDEVVKAAAGNEDEGKKVMALILDQRGDQITITDEVVKAAAGNSGNGKEVMALLLDRRGDQITITDERGDQITITDEVVKAAAGNSGNGKEVMALLLDRRGDQITITDEVVKAAAGNFGNGKEVMALLLDRRGDQITITDEVVKAAAGNFRNGKEVMALLLNRRGDQITITDEVVKAAAGNEDEGKEVMALILDQRGDQITITDEVAEAAATCGQHGVLNLLSQNGLVSVREEWRCIANFYNAATAGQLPGDHLCSGHLGVVWNEL